MDGIGITQQELPLDSPKAILVVQVVDEAIHLNKNGLHLLFRSQIKVLLSTKVVCLLNFVRDHVQYAQKPLTGSS